MLRSVEVVQRGESESQSVQEPEVVRPWEIAAWSATDVSDLRSYDEQVDARVRSDELVLVSRQLDRDVPGRVHEGFAQYHEGVRVHGGNISRQLANGVTVSIFGKLHEEINVETTPRLSMDEALDRVARESGVEPVTSSRPELVVLPTLFNTYALAWRVQARDLRTYFVDAHTGRIVHDESAVHEQAAVGIGRGIQGQPKKLSTSRAGGGFQAHDRLRPAEIVTLDLDHREHRWESLMDADGPKWRPSDVASDNDNNWRDAAVVDAHAYAGFTYDWFARQGWHGMDGRNGRVMSMVNLSPDYANAYFAPPPFGPEKTGVIAFGREDDGTPIVSADVVAHEFMHGVTHFSMQRRTGDPLGSGYDSILGPSRFTLPGGLRVVCGWRYRYTLDSSPLVAGRRFHFQCRQGRLVLWAAQGSATNEAYSDIFGTAVEFAFHRPPSGPLRADWVIAEDVGPVWRSLENPRSKTLSAQSSLRYPAAHRDLIRFVAEVFEDNDRVYNSNIGSVDAGRTLVWLPSWGYSGSHWNSTILSHAYYLAVQGGRNRTTGRRVFGVGGANRLDIERVFLRAMRDLMPNSPSMQMAARAIRQSAIDLFGAGNSTYAAITQALRAVDL